MQKAIIITKEYNHHKIEVNANLTSGQETLKIDGKLISSKQVWFKSNSYHDFEIYDNEKKQKGFVQIRTFSGDSLV